MYLLTETVSPFALERWALSLLTLANLPKDSYIPLAFLSVP